MIKVRFACDKNLIVLLPNTLISERNKPLSPKAFIILN